jgi:hypothetical protein
MAKLELTKASLVELKPDHQYIIAIDNNMVTRNDMVTLGESLPENISKNVTIMAFRGDPKNGLQVIEKKVEDGYRTNKPS